MAKKSYSTKTFELFNNRPINEKLFDKIIEDCEKLTKDIGNFSILKEKLEYTTNDWKKLILGSNVDYFTLCFANYMMEYIISHLWCHVYDTIRKTPGGNEREAENLANNKVQEFIKKYK